MKEFKGTKGPWFVDGFGDVNDTPEITESTICIAACRGVIDIERDRHNANLIASAPDLLKELQRAAEVYDALLSDGYLAYKDDSIRASAAIAKALGESK